MRREQDTPTTTVMYNGIAVGYYESDNQWTFELRGRERTVDSLKAAKEAIDKPVEEKKPKFKPVAAFKYDSWGYSGPDNANFIPVTITSFIEGGRYAWVQSEESKGYRSSGRSKELSDSLYLDTPENILLINTWKATQDERKILTEKMDALKKKMKTGEQLAKEIAE